MMNGKGKSCLPDGIQEEGHQASQHDEDGEGGEHDSGNDGHLHGRRVFCGLVPVHGADDLEVVVEAGGRADDHDGKHPAQVQARVDDVHEGDHFGEEAGRQRHARQGGEHDGDGQGQPGIGPAQAAEGGDFLAPALDADHGEGEEGAEGHDQVYGQVEWGVRGQPPVHGADEEGQDETGLRDG